MPLLLLNAGEKKTVLKIVGKDLVRKRVQELGIIEGDTIEVLSYLAGNIIVLVKNTKLAISNEVASKIQVY